MIHRKILELNNPAVRRRVGVTLARLSVAITLVQALVSISQIAFAASAPTLQKHVDEYWLLKSQVRVQENQCAADLSGCVSEVCNRLGKFCCDQQNEVIDVLHSCRGNYSGDCLVAVCEKLGRYDCDDISEIGPMLLACAGNIDGGCVRTVCAKLGTFGCAHANDVIAVARACGGSP